MTEAADAAGVTIGTLAHWARAGRVGSRLEAGAYGERRVVQLDDVLAAVAGDPVAKAPRSAAANEPPPGTVLVPLEAWQRALDQIAHLHEAGRELAEARAAAAKFETTSDFLRERVRELQAELVAARSPARHRRLFRRMNKIVQGTSSPAP